MVQRSGQGIPANRFYTPKIGDTGLSAIAKDQSRPVKAGVIWTIDGVYTQATSDEGLSHGTSTSVTSIDSCMHRALPISPPAPTSSVHKELSAALG